MLLRRFRTGLAWQYGLFFVTIAFKVLVLVSMRFSGRLINEYFLAAMDSLSVRCGDGGIIGFRHDVLDGSVAIAVRIDVALTHQAIQYPK